MLLMSVNSFVFPLFYINLGINKPIILRRKPLLKVYDRKCTLLFIHNESNHMIVPEHGYAD